MHDPTVLRAIAHPVRSRILGELSAQGSLRQLAKYGLVEEDPEAARDKRDRVWRAVSPEGLSISLADVEKAPGGKAAARVFRGQAAALGHQLVDAAYAESKPEDSHRTVADHTLRLSSEEAAELSRELVALLDGWADRTRGRDPERRTYSAFVIVQPLPPA